jgi:hypothetical protein
MVQAVLLCTQCPSSPLSPFVWSQINKLLTSARLVSQLAGLTTGGGVAVAATRAGRWTGGGVVAATTWAGRPGVAVRLATVAGRSRNDGRGSTVVGIL